MGGRRRQPDPPRGGLPADRARRARIVAALALAALPVACGFKLRGSAALPFETIYLGFGPSSQVGTELARNIRSGTGARVVPERSQAQAIFELLGENREREAVAISPQGRVVEVRLRLTVTFRVHDDKGRDFIGPTTLTTFRDVSYDEQQILAKEAEEQLLWRNMQSDLVQQVLRRMSAATV